MICRNHVDVMEGVRRCTRCGSPFCSDCLVDISGQPYCATCKTEQLLDVRSGVDAALDYASVGRRFGASFLDGLITGIPSITLVFMIFGIQPGANRFTTPAFYIPAVCSLLYQAIMLSTRGQTLGKMALNVKVVRLDGGDITPGQAWGRELMRAVLGCTYIVDYLPAFFTPDHKTIHDMVANTRVVNWA